MRLVHMEYVVPGYKLGKAICEENGRVLLTEGVILTEAFIRKLRELDIPALYIDDEISEGLDIPDVVSFETRIEAKKIIKNVIEKQTMSLDKSYAKLSKVVNNIVDEILTNKNHLTSLVDIKTKDSYTFSHCVNVAVISTVIGVSMGYPMDKLRKLCLGGLLHDIGKVAVPKEILNKPGKLTDDEFEEMKKHSEYGYNMVKESIEYCPITKGIILMHHEKSDGSGYPLGLTYEKIHECARIVAVADIYDAMTSDRVYRKRISPNEAVEYLVGMAYKWFDIPVISHFKKCVAPYPIGSCVLFNNGEIGIVIRLNNEFPTRPVVKIIKTKDGEAFTGEKILDLTRELTTYIEDLYTM